MPKRSRLYKFFALAAGFILCNALANAQTGTSHIALSTRPLLTVVHPVEGAQLPPIKQMFVFGAVTPGSTLMINGQGVPVHPKGGYLAMVPVQPGNQVLSLEEKTPSGETVKLDRHFTIGSGFVESPVKPTTIVKESIEPSSDLLLAPGDQLVAAFQGSPMGQAEFSIDDVAKHVPMADVSISSTGAGRGQYQGMYVIQPNDHAQNSEIAVRLKGVKGSEHQKAPGHLTIDPGTVPHMGVITEGTVAVRTGPEGGYDLFLYRGMRVRLTGKVHHEWRVQLSSLQTGWIKESAVQELPAGSRPARSTLANMIMAHFEDSTEIRVPLDDALPFRTEQTLDPMRLTVTLYGAVNRTDFIRYDPLDRLIRHVAWKQVSPDTCQIIIQPRFKHWWGYDVRYEPGALVIEIRKPWTRPTLRGMLVAVDPGHGGSEYGATGPHNTLEKDANLEIARVVKRTLEEAGANVILTRYSDQDLPLYERPKIAWRNRARLFVSVHCNASGEGENPLENNGFSTYWYHPQSMALASAVHAHYAKTVGLPDRGLFFSDFAVCRMTQMPAILTEQAYIILPEQELLIFTPSFRKACARSILNGIRDFISENREAEAAPPAKKAAR